MDWSQWSPTIISAITCIFFAGGVYQRQNSQAQTLRDHAETFQDHKRELELIKSASSLQAVDIGMLKAWRDGWNAARATYERGSMQPAPGGD